MGAASVRAPLVGYERQTEPKTTSEEVSPTTDESHIQFTLAEVTPNPLSSPITSRTTPPRPSTAHAEQLNNPSNAVDAPEFRGTKRTAEDAEFEDLAEIVSEVLTGDQNLRDQINNIDKRIEQLQTQLRDLVEKRKDAKRRFMRQTLAIASRTDG
jgi:TolA-binding protein